MPNYNGGGANSLLERRFLLFKKEEVDNDMFDLVDTVNGTNSWGRVSVSFKAQDNSFYLLIPSDNSEDIMFAVNIVNAKYAFMAMSNKTTAGALCETNYGLSNNTIVISKSIAKNEQKSITFNVYKMK
nr:MAG TPA: hypothetical protein [Caudoviricetes sp.]